MIRRVTSDREATLAAIAGTAVDRLFLGGPLHGKVCTVNPAAMPVLAQVPKIIRASEMPGPVRPEDYAEFETMIVEYYPREVGPGPPMGRRTVMCIKSIEDPEETLKQWLLLNWMLEELDGGGQR